MKNIILAVLLLTGFQNITKGDSPLTSTFFANAYKDLLIIKTEIEDDSRVLSEEECKFLFDDLNSLDQKIALINALGWGDTTLVVTYTKYLSKQYNLPLAVFDSILVWRGGQPVTYEPAAKLKAHDFTCLAYLQTMGNYFAPLKGYYCAYHAADINASSEAASYVFGLIMAQYFLDNDWCNVYQVMYQVRNFDSYAIDRLRSEAISSIFEYIDIYQESCKESLKEENTNTNINNTDPQAVYTKPISRQTMQSKKDFVDLTIIDVKYPEYTDSNKGSRVVVKIKNNGNFSSIETNACMRDLDISAAEAKKLKLSNDEIEIIKENNNNATAKGEWIKTGIDSDFDWAIYAKIPVLQPGEEFELIFDLNDYWIYDPNCEIEILLDFDNNIDEKDKKNNVKYLIAWG